MRGRRGRRLCYGTHPPTQPTLLFSPPPSSFLVLVKKSLFLFPSFFPGTGLTLVWAPPYFLFPLLLFFRFSPVLLEKLQEVAAVLNDLSPSPPKVRWREKYAVATWGREYTGQAQKGAHI